MQAMLIILNRSALVALLIVGSIAVASSSAMETLVVTGGFEERPADPKFEVGALAGQNSWLQTGGSDSTAAVMAITGGQAVQIDHNTQDRRWAVLPSGSYPTGRYVTITWDMAVNVTQEPGVLGPFFGVEAYGADGNYTVLGSLGVDATSGEVLIQQAATGYFVAPGPIVDDGVWNHFAIELDYLDDKYRTYLNGNLLATTTFVDDDKNELDTFSDADISTLAVAASGGRGQPGTDTAWLDNFLVLDGIAGDFSSDGNLGLADYTVWRDALGSTGFAPPADGTGNGVVDAADYQVWKANFGRNNALMAPLISPAAVPEPATAMIAGVVATLFAARRRR